MARPTRPPRAPRIRADLLPEIHAVPDGAAGRLRAEHLGDNETLGYAEIVEGADTLIAEERASWWIEHRGCSVHSLLQQRVMTAGQAAPPEARS